jgi:hypothetical protein
LWTPGRVTAPLTLNEQNIQNIQNISSAAVSGVFWMFWMFCFPRGWERESPGGGPCDMSTPRTNSGGVQGAFSSSIDLNAWHHAIHLVTGDMSVLFNRASAADLKRWSRALRHIADEMEAAE